MKCSNYRTTSEQDSPHDNDQDERHGEDDEQLRGAEADVAGHQGPDAAPEAA